MADRVACIDPLSGIDLSPFYSLIFNDGVLKLMHAARQDMEIFFDATGRLPAPLFDTQVAAALLGMGEQIGYSALVEKICGVALSKAHVRTDWMRRPLDKGAIDYAADDVRYLPSLYHTLDGALNARGRRSWLEEEQSPLLDLKTYRPDESDAWQRVKGAGKMKGVSLAVAGRLAVWREGEARRNDRPRRWVLSDEAVVDLARQRPRGEAELTRMRSLEENTRKKHGASLVALIAEAEALPKEAWPAPLDQENGVNADEALVNALSALLQIQAKAHDVSAGMLATRGDLQRAASGERMTPLFKGWRNDLAGCMLAAFLEGKSSLRVKSGKLVIRAETCDQK